MLTFFFYYEAIYLIIEEGPNTNVVPESTMGYGILDSTI